LAVEGAVVRAVGGWTAVRLTRGIHLGRTLSEQRRILRDYPGGGSPVEGAESRLTRSGSGGGCSSARARRPSPD
jgi:hypothetical protein